MPDDVKKGTSEKIVQYLDSRFVSNEDKKKDKMKGVSQLINQIEKLNINFNLYENLDYDKNQIIIFPIIIYTDSSFMVSGINNYLNKVFRTKILEKKLDAYSVHILTMISTDFFIEKFDYLKTNSKALPSLIHSYYNLKICYNKCAKNANDIIHAQSSFEHILSHKFKPFKKLETTLLNELLEKYKWTYYN